MEDGQTSYQMWPFNQMVSSLHPSVTDPVESLSSLGFWKKRHWVGQFPTGSAYFPVGFFSYAYLIQKWPVVENERFLLFFHYPLPRKWLLYSG